MSRTKAHKPWQVLVKENYVEVHRHENSECTIDDDTDMTCYREVDIYAVNKNGHLCSCKLCRPVKDKKPARRNMKQQLKKARYEIEPHEAESALDASEDTYKPTEQIDEVHESIHNTRGAKYIF